MQLRKKPLLPLIKLRRSQVSTERRGTSIGSLPFIAAVHEPTRNAAEILKKKSSLFRRDMRRLNMMKEVRALVEASKRIENVKSIDVQEPRNDAAQERREYAFPYKRRSSVSQYQFKRCFSAATSPRERTGMSP